MNNSIKMPASDSLKISCKYKGPINIDGSRTKLKHTFVQGEQISYFYGAPNQDQDDEETLIESMGYKVIAGGNGKIGMVYAALNPQSVTGYDEVLKDLYKKLGIRNKTISHH